MSQKSTKTAVMPTSPVAPSTHVVRNVTVLSAVILLIAYLWSTSIPSHHHNDAVNHFWDEIPVRRVDWFSKIDDGNSDDNDAFDRGLSYLFDRQQPLVFKTHPALKWKAMRVVNQSVRMCICVSVETFLSVCAWLLT